VCDNPSGPPELHPVVSEGRVGLSVVFYAVCPFLLFLMALALSALV